MNAAEAAVSLTRGNYFEEKERGELRELKDELNSELGLVRREAVRKVIAGMTAASAREDFGSLFPDILRCLQSKDVETKRLVYLYISNYAMQHADLVLLAMNTFVRDTENKRSSQVRCLALRTITSLPLPSVVEYVDDPLRRGLKDEHPSVRRTAVMAIGKLCMRNREYFDDMELEGTLLELFMVDKDGWVSASALAVILECGIACDSQKMLSRLATLFDANPGEWGLVHVLRAYGQFAVNLSWEEASHVLKRVSACLNHGNPAVVMAAIKVILLTTLNHPDHVALYDRRVSACLSTLVQSGPPELRFVVLELVKDIVTSCPSFAPNLQYLTINPDADPLYLTNAKLQVIASIANRDNLLVILGELCENVKHHDPQFTDLIIATMRDLAVRFDGQFREMIVKQLIDVALTGLVPLFQSSVIALRSLNISDVDYSSILTVYLAFTQPIEKDEAKCAVLWMCRQTRTVGVQVLMRFIDSLVDESSIVQSAVLETSHLLDTHLFEQACLVLKKLNHSFDISERIRFYIDCIDHFTPHVQLTECEPVRYEPVPVDIDSIGTFESMLVTGSCDDDYDEIETDSVEDTDAVKLNGHIQAEEIEDIMTNFEL